VQKIQLNMIYVEIFLICAYAIFQIIEATSPDVSGTALEEVDPYATYDAYREDVDPIAAYNAYQAVYGALSDRSSRSDVLEKQSFASEVKAIMSDNEAIMLGTIAAVFAGLSFAAVTLNIVNTNSICTTAKALGDTSLSLTSTTNVPDNTGATAATSNVVFANIRTRLNLIENQLNGYATPHC